MSSDGDFSNCNVDGESESLSIGSEVITSMVVGENGALSHKTSDNPILDLSFALVRGLESSRIESYFREIIGTDDVSKIVDLFLLSFATRNCRGGKGEKQLFQKLFSLLFSVYPETCSELMVLLPKYGYWKDLFVFISDFKRILKLTKEQVISGEPFTQAREKKVHGINCNLANPFISAQNVFKTQINDDLQKISVDGDSASISLAAKWAPREKSEFAKRNVAGFQYLVDSISELSESGSIDHLNVEGDLSTRSDGEKLKRYRKIISKLNNHIDTVEIKMSSGRYSEIDYSKAPSVCVSKFRLAHLNLLKDVHCDDNERGNRFPESHDRVEGRKNLMNKIKLKKVKGTQVEPHTIISDILNHRVEDETLDLVSVQWDDIRSKCQLSKNENFIPVCDVSGSMQMSSSLVIPIEVCISFGILLSEITHPSFRDRVITFSSNPKWINLEGLTLSEKVTKLRTSEWANNTDLLKTFDMILDVIIERKIPQDEIPTLVIFSDMQFDSAIGGSSGYPYGCPVSCRETGKSTFDLIKERFNDAGLHPPKIVFWNLSSRTGIPVKGSTPNTSLLSGYSQSLFKYITTGEFEEMTPEKTLRAMLDDEIYDPVREILLASNEGLLSGYSLPPCDDCETSL